MKKRKILNVWLAMSFFLLGMDGMAGSTVDSNSIVEDGIEYSIQTDKAVYSLGENVQMLYRVTNLSEDEVEFIFTYGPLDNTCDWMVDKDELRIWDNLGRPGTMVMTSFNLSPSTSYEYTHTWNMTYKNGDDILPGNYNVTGVLGYHPDHERYVPVSVQIEIIPEPAMIYYVDDDATGANDGSSWADAYNWLQDALAAAYFGDKIWVAQGIYKPDEGGGNTSGDREATFQLINGVTIKGGYAGFGETDPNDRDVDVYKTVLSGDLAGDDGPDFANNSENSWHVVRGSGTTTAILDGFTVTGGNANGSSSYYYSGGGMYNQSGRVTILNCTFIGNWARDFGGGMYNNHSTPMLTNCTFTCNMAREGGGMFNSNMSSPVLTNCTFIENIVVKDEGSFGGGIYNDNSSPILTNCTFTRNVAGVLIPDHGGGEGGGMYNRESSPTLTNCTFSGNTALCGGGGMGNRRSSPTLNNCIFTGNLAIGKEGRWGDGGAIFNASSTPLIKSCTFSGNSAGRSGGGMFNSSSHSILTNCIFWGDIPEEIRLGHNSTALITYSDVQGGWLGTGNIDTAPYFVEAGYWDANGTWVDGDYHLLVDSPCIDAADPNYIAGPNETDLDGKPRVIGGRIDMGAYEYSPPIPAEVRVVPRSINLASMGKWITCYIRLPEDYNVADINPNTVFLQSEIQAQSLSLDEGQQVARAKFNRSDVQEILDAGEVELTITGRLTNGFAFEGTDVIRVIDKGRGK